MHIPAGEGGRADAAHGDDGSARLANVTRACARFCACVRAGRSPVGPRARACVRVRARVRVAARLGHVGPHVGGEAVLGPQDPLHNLHIILYYILYIYIYNIIFFLGNTSRFTGC